MSEFYFEDRNCKILQENKEEMLKELGGLTKEMFIPFHKLAGYIDTVQKDGLEYRKKDWFIFPLMYFGETIEEIEAMFPVTIRVLREIGTISSYLSLINEKDIIKEHRDVGFDNTKTKRYHLCVKAEKDKSYLQVEEEKIYYEKGLIFGFDNAKRHQAVNNSEEDRIVLLFDGLLSKDLKIENLDYPEEDLVEIKNKFKTFFQENY